MKYIASWSGGKDSTASIILAHEHNEPLDMIIFSEVMFDENISGELPEHIDFIKHKAIPMFESWGYEVKILHSDKTYMDCFNHVVTTSKNQFRNGKRQGFPIMGACKINDRCKVRAINLFFKGLGKIEYTKYIGIAKDEPERLSRLKFSDENRVSLLRKYGYTEQMAYNLCKKYDLLSPVYQFSNRGGGWFCPNAKEKELKNLRSKHPELWRKLLELENEPNLIIDKWNAMRKIRIHDLEERFFWEDRQMNIFDYLKED